jgi:hypothetical protein
MSKERAEAVITSLQEVITRNNNPSNIIELLERTFINIQEITNGHIVNPHDNNSNIMITMHSADSLVMIGRESPSSIGTSTPDSGFLVTLNLYIK